MHDPAFMVIRVGKHREKIRAVDYKASKWPAGHEILSGMPPIPAEVVAEAENTAAESVSGVSGAPEALKISDAPVADVDAIYVDGQPLPYSEWPLDALKIRADRMNIPYGSNIGAKTLASRISEAEAYISGERE